MSVIKKRLQRLFLFFSLALLFSMCKENKPYSEPVVGLGGDGYLSIALSSENVTLRNGGIDVYSDINNVVLLFFSQETEKLEVIKVVNNPSKGEALSVRLPRSNYRLIAVANPTEKVLSFCYLGCQLKDFENVEIEGISNLRRLNEDGSVQSLTMINAQGAVDVSQDCFKEKSEQTQPISVELESCLASLRIYGTPTLDKSIKASALAGSFFVTGVSKSTFLMRRMSVLIGSSTPEKPNDQSPLSQRFAQSVGYQEILSSQPESLDQLLSQYRTYTHDKRTNINKFVIKAKKEDYTGQEHYIYFPETTVDASHFFYSCIPFAYIRYQLYPATLSDTFNPENGWLRYKGVCYDGKALTQYVELLKKSNTATTEDLPKELAQIIKTLYSTRRLPIYQDGVLGEFDLDGVEYYYKSYNYFLTPIFHQKGVKEVGRFGLVRHNIYNIHIKHIAHLGTPTIPNLSMQHTSYKELENMGGMLIVPSPEEHLDEIEL